MKLWKHIKNVFSGCVITLLSVACIGSGTVDAAIEYDSKTDSFVSDESGYYATMKEASGKIKLSELIFLPADKPISLDGLKISETKDAYLYFTETRPEADLADAMAVLYVGKTPYNRIQVAMDYTSIDLTLDESDAELEEEDRLPEQAVAMITGKQEKDEVILYKKGEAFASDDSIFLWSANQSVWREGSELNGSVLRQNLKFGTNLYFKVIGDDLRPSKAVKVKIPKQGTAPSIKLDVNKLTLNIKNGYDFALNPKEDSYIAWWSVLPYDRNGRVNREEASLVFTEDFIPNDKKLTLDFHTSIKMKALPISYLVNCDIPNFSEESFVLLVRKSATLRKPASAVTQIQVGQQALEPVVQANPEEDLLATGTAIEFILPELKNAEGDTTLAKYELAVIDVQDYDKDLVDWSSVRWKTVKSGMKLNQSLKTKYNLMGIKEAAETKLDETTYLVLRRKGFSKKDQCIPASAHTVLMFTKEEDVYNFYK